MSRQSSNPFFRRYGGYIFGGILAAALVGIAVVGKNTGGSSELKQRYFSKYVTKAVSKQQTQSDPVQPEEPEEELTSQQIYEKFFNIEELGLRYKAHIIGFTNELENMLYYDVTFSKDLPDNIKEQIEEEIVKKCGKNIDDNKYGEVIVEVFKDKKKVGITLNLNDINTDKAILGIFKALDEIDGVESATLDGKNDPNVQKLSDDCNKSYKTDELGLDFPVYFFKEPSGSCVTYDIVMKEKPESFEITVYEHHEDESSLEDSSEGDSSSEGESSSDGESSSESKSSSELENKLDEIRSDFSKISDTEYKLIIRSDKGNANDYNVVRLFLQRISENKGIKQVKIF